MKLSHFVELIAELHPNSQLKYVRGEDVCTFIRVEASEPRVVTKTPQGKEFFFAGSYLSLLADRIKAYVPFNISQLMNNSGSYRPVVETIIAHTREFYWLHKNGARFVVWIPSHPHDVGTLVQWTDIDGLEGLAATENKRGDDLDSSSLCQIISLPTAKDILTVAIEQFKAHRLDAEWVEKLKRDGYEGIRARYEGMNPDTLRDMDESTFDQWIKDELWAARTFFCGEKIKGLSAEDKKAFCAFIAASKKNFRLITSYFGKDAKLPNGVGPAVATELLMKFHPNDFFTYNTLMLQGLKTIGLVDDDNAPNVVTPTGYFKLIGFASDIVERLKAIEVPRGFEENADVPPDYITANEFLWWCKVHQDLIKEKVMKEAYRKTEIKLPTQKPIDGFGDFIEAFRNDADAAGLKYSSNLVRRFVCALWAKPFVVLTGLSGSGKTKLAQAFAEWIAVEGTSCIVSVGADWTNSEKMLGYPNGLDPENYILPDSGVLKLMIDANDNPNVPFFLILDEMNLSHVERYFADFLSAMESKGRIKLYDGAQRTASNGTPIPQEIDFPPNLFVIGTMNVDETTHAFSPKVLDRAQVIEFRVTPDEMKSYLASSTVPDVKKLSGKGTVFAEAFKKLHDAPLSLTAADKKAIADALNKFFPDLAELGSEFAYRTAGEAVAFCAFARSAGMSMDEAIDAAIMQKLLPKLHGSRRRLALPLETFWGFCRKDDRSETLADLFKKDSSVTVQDVAKYPISAEKIRRLYKAVESNGFASYAEA